MDKLAATGNLRDSPNRPEPLSYATPPLRAVRVPGINGWWVILALLPVFLFLVNVARRDPSHSPRYGKAVSASLSWTFIAMGVRAVVGIIRRERTRVWTVYLSLYILLPIAADMAATYAVRHGWVP
jgi:hypothetical protein